MAALWIPPPQRTTFAGNDGGDCSSVVMVMVRHDLRAAFRGAAAVIEGKGAAAGPTRNPVAAPTSMALSASRMRRAMLEGTGWIEDSR
mmetsp:Transcript_24/g.70  ORF Transcript_24/g.70 Transcript_24/m.70 type:complete len:88 (-) Transcript_24:59-322(-)